LQAAARQAEAVGLKNQAPSLFFHILNE